MFLIVINIITSKIRTRAHMSSTIFPGPVQLKHRRRTNQLVNHVCAKYKQDVYCAIFHVLYRKKEAKNKSREGGVNVLTEREESLIKFQSPPKSNSIL